MTEHAINEFLSMCKKVETHMKTYNIAITKRQTANVSLQVQYVKNWVAENQSFLYRSRADALDLYQKAFKEGLKSIAKEIYFANIPTIDPQDKAIPENIKFIKKETPVAPSDVPTSSTYDPETGTVVHTPAGHPPVAERKAVHIPIEVDIAEQTQSSNQEFKEAMSDVPPPPIQTEAKKVYQKEVRNALEHAPIEYGIEPPHHVEIIPPVPRPVPAHAGLTFQQAPAPVLPPLPEEIIAEEKTILPITLTASPEGFVSQDKATGVYPPEAYTPWRGDRFKQKPYSVGRKVNLSEYYWYGANHRPQTTINAKDFIFAK